MILSEKNFIRIVLQLTNAIFVSVYIYHLAFFSWSTGFCLSGNTGRVAGNQSINAGALILRTNYVLSLNLARPFSSLFVIFSDAIIAILLTAALVFVISNYISKKPRNKVWQYLVLPLIIMLVCLIECNFSCELHLSHKSIQYLYSEKSEKIINYDLRKTIPDTTAEIYELRGDMGEPACRAFIIMLDPKQDKINEEWIDSNGVKTLKNHTLNSIYKIASSQYSSDNLLSLHISASEFANKNNDVAKYRAYSAIGCLAWPYSWLDELP